MHVKKTNTFTQKIVTQQTRIDLTLKPNNLLKEPISTKTLRASDDLNGQIISSSHGSDAP